MFTKGNRKLGKSVAGFSIPAKKTCPGSTALCRSVCYATKGYYSYKSVGKSLAANLAAARGPDFAKRAAAEILVKGLRLVRVHVSGDLFGPEYAAAWVRVMRACPETVFWLYTRSWRVKRIRPHLAKMAALPNVRLWFSADAETGLPRTKPGRVRVAWMQTDGAVEPAGPVDLVFRSRNLKKTVATRVAGAKVCPTETGLASAESVTCEGCGFCFERLPGDRASPIGRVALPVVA